MATQHTVQEGDGMSRIGDLYGFFWQTLWNHPDNKDLKTRRDHPEFLLPGDVVQIPDKRQQRFSGSTDLRHRYRLKGVPARLNIRLLDDEDEPRAGLTYKLEIDSGKVMSGKTDGGGWIRCFVPPGARSGKLSVRDGGEVYDVNFGYIDPFDTVSGAQGVLKNLGYFKGEADGTLDGATIIALEEFQSVKGIPVTGQLDGATVAALKAAYLG